MNIAVRALRLHDDSTYAAVRWLMTPHEALDGRSPNQMVTAGYPGRVKALLRVLQAAKGKACGREARKI